MKLLKKVLLPVLAVASMGAGSVSDVALAQEIANDSSKTVQISQPTVQLKSTISGHIYDDKTGEPMIGASIQIKGTSKGAATDVNGFYKINDVEEGPKEILIRSIGYSDLEKSLFVDEPQEKLDVRINEKTVELKPVTVTAERKKGESEKAALAERRTSESITDGYTKEFIARTPDSDAGEVLKRNVGTAVVGEELYARGLPPRYSNVKLEGITPPSTKSEDSNVELDLFPTASIKQIKVSKSFTPDKSADFASASANIELNTSPPNSWISISASKSINSETTRKGWLTYDGGKKDWLAKDDGTRAMPSELKNSAWRETPESIEKAGEALSSIWTPHSEKAPLNSSYKINAGRIIGLGEEKSLSIIGALNYKNSYKTNNTTHKEFGGGVPEYEINEQVGERSVEIGSMMNNALKLSPNHRLLLTGMYAQSATDESRIGRGYDENSYGNFEETHIHYVSREMKLGKLRGEHKVFGANLDWTISGGGSSR